MERELGFERRRYSLLAGQMELLRPNTVMPGRTGDGAAETLSA
jgi:hypothetical protein